MRAGSVIGADGLGQAAQERLPALAQAQCLFGTGALGRRPRPVSSDFNERNLVASPIPGGGAVDTEARKPATIFNQRRPDEGGGLARKQLLALRIRESRVRADVIDDDGLAATARVDGGLPESCDWTASGIRRHAVGKGTVDDELTRPRCARS